MNIQFLSAPRGSGKTTRMKQLLKDYTDTNVGVLYVDLFKTGTQLRTPKDFEDYVSKSLIGHRYSVLIIDGLECFDNDDTTLGHLMNSLIFIQKRYMVKIYVTMSYWAAI